MDDIIEKLEKLNLISSQLDLNENQRNAILKKLNLFTNRYLNGLDEDKAFVDHGPDSLAITGEKQDFETVMNQYESQVVNTGLRPTSGKFMGYIPGGGLFVSVIADYLAAVTNPYSGIYYASPGAATIENEVIQWIKSVFSFPASAVGTLSSGGSLSTVNAFTAARERFGVKNGEISRHVVYLSQQVHHSTQKALRIIGLEDIQIRYIPMDNHHRMESLLLEKQILKDQEHGFKPFLVVATAGTTDTGAIDPLDKIADIAERYKLWYHVDAAYGGFFILTAVKERFKGIERADSLIVDPHKSMFLPYGLGAVLIKDRESALKANNFFANYMQDAANDAAIMNPSNLSPELTRHFRGLRLWLPIQMHGIEPFVACLEEKLLLTQYFREKLIESGFKVGPVPDLSVSYFWYPFGGENEDELNRRLLAEMHRDGDAYLSSSIIENRFVIRIAVLGFRTKKESIDRAMAMIERALKKAKA